MGITESGGKEFFGFALIDLCNRCVSKWTTSSFETEGKYCLYAVLDNKLSLEALVDGEKLILPKESLLITDTSKVAVKTPMMITHSRMTSDCLWPKTCFEILHNSKKYADSWFISDFRGHAALRKMFQDFEGNPEKHMKNNPPLGIFSAKTILLSPYCPKDDLMLKVIRKLYEIVTENCKATAECSYI